MYKLTESKCLRINASGLQGEEGGVTFVDIVVVYTTM